MVIHIATDKPYDVLVENGALDRAGEAVKPLFKPGSQAMIVSETNVFPIYGERLTASLTAAGFRVSHFVFGAGEQQKQLSTVMQIYEALSEHGFTRSDFIVTLGGGVAGDMGGFAAATFLRGIDFVQVPTSLLAQVDASVGGKTGVDLPFGKNLVGAFHQPRLVISDPQTLSTLSDDFFTDGLGEVIKYGCIMDAELFGQLERGEVIDRLEETICRCVQCKKILVEEDATDKGHRMILNFGHTFGHALEKLTGFSALSHGRAVGIGMVMAGEVGESLGITEMGTAARIRRVLESYGMPTESEFDFSEVVEATALDKKSFGKTLNLILLKSIGECVIHPVDRSYLVLRYKIAAEQKRRRK
ncbi:MAG: 3-dehydroquinate synthase [Ruminococcus bromii]|nr:3-dehydroquinate synthase [Ruminococcus bromii]